MRPVSLLALYEGFRSVPEGLLAAYEAQLSERERPLKAVKSHEAASVVALVDALRGAGYEASRLFEGFVFSFRIPQISSEFDLLKICDDAVVNIELKIEDVGTSRIRAQLARNRYYLAPLEKKTFTFTYVVEQKALYELREGEPVAQVNVTRLGEVLASTGMAYEGIVEDLFKVSNYLVSPLNDTQRFLEGSYFLTNHQAQIKAAFMHACTGVDAAVRAPAFVVYGSAGTGKTLLLYDIAKTLSQTCRVCVVHCGVLSEGHEALNQSQDGFYIVAAKHSEREDFTGYGAILIDEAQRMWPRQLEHVVTEASAHALPLYLSMDRRQILKPRKESFDPQAVVQDLHGNTQVFELSRKIRTNRELADFIRALFGLRGAPKVASTRHVKVCSAADVEGARRLVNAYRAEGYQFIELADPGDADDAALAAREVLVSGSPTPSQVIGQEFDRIVMAVGPSLVAEERGSLGSARLYQGLTRARDDIALVTYGNEGFLRRVLEVTGAL